MARPRKQEALPPERRQWAIDQVNSFGRPVADVAREIRISKNTLYVWLKAERERNVANGPEAQEKTDVLLESLKRDLQHALEDRKRFRVVARRLASVVLTLTK